MSEEQGCDSSMHKSVRQSKLPSLLSRFVNVRFTINHFLAVQNLKRLKRSLTYDITALALLLVLQLELMAKKVLC